jgi:hypothetical protein
MTWDAATPNDETYAANQIHLQIQNDKEMIRERFEASDGTINAHYAADSEDAGKHQPSLVGFCKIHATTAAMNTWVAANSAIDGSLHAVSTPKSLWLIEAGSPKQIWPVSHSDLGGLADDDHTQYMPDDLGRAFTGNLSIASLQITVGAITGSGAISTDHVSDDWETAHGSSSFGGKHLGSDAVRHRHLVVSTETSNSGYYTHPGTNGMYGFPWAVTGTGSQPIAFGFFQLSITLPDNTVGFQELGVYFNGSIKYGKFSS